MNILLGSGDILESEDFFTFGKPSWEWGHWWKAENKLLLKTHLFKIQHFIYRFLCCGSDVVLFVGFVCCFSLSYGLYCNALSNCGYGKCCIWSFIIILERKGLFEGYTNLPFNLSLTLDLILYDAFLKVLGNALYIGTQVRCVHRVISRWTGEIHINTLMITMCV